MCTLHSTSGLLDRFSRVRLQLCRDGLLQQMRQELGPKAITACTPGLDVQGHMIRNDAAPATA